MGEGHGRTARMHTFEESDSEIIPMNHSNKDGKPYCPSTEYLSDEHIIALGLGGNLVFPKASCELHRKATCKVEDFVLRRYLCPLRSHLSLPSRNPRLRPNRYPLLLRNGTYSWKKNVKLSQHPGVVRFVKLAGSKQRGSRTRPCFHAILDLVSFGGRGMNLIPSELQRIRTQMGEESLEGLIRAAGIKKRETKKKQAAADVQRS